MKQREIKFRAWDKRLKRMVNIEVVNIEGNEGYDYYNWYDQYDGCSYALKNLMQYTGLKDKNGKEIYFDDIIRTKLGIGVIVWMDDRIGVASGDIGNYHAVDSITKEEIEQSEIIGNIYENAELPDPPTTDKQ